MGGGGRGAVRCGASLFKKSLPTHLFFSCFFFCPVPPAPGVPRANAYVRQFSVQYSYDCSSYTTYTENGVERRFAGNWDTSTVARNEHAPVWAKCYRIFLRDWRDVTPGMRVELYAYAQAEQTKLSGARHAGYLGVLFRDGCPPNQLLLREASTNAKTTLAPAVAYDMSASLPTTTRDSTWPRVIIQSETPLTFTQAGTSTYSFTAKTGAVLTDACSTTVTVLDGARSLNPSLCPADDLVLVDDGRMDAKYEWTRASGVDSNIAPGSRLRLGRNVIFHHTSTSYCSFTVEVTLRKFCSEEKRKGQSKLRAPTGERKQESGHTVGNAPVS